MKIYKLRHKQFVFYFGSKSLLDKAVDGYINRPNEPRGEDREPLPLLQMAEAVINTKTNQMTKCRKMMEDLYESTLVEKPTIVSLEDLRYQSYQEVISKVGGADDFMTRCLPDITAKELMDILVSNGIEFKVKDRHDLHI